MNRIATAVLLVLLAGCARVRVAQADYERRSCVTCGNRYAGMEELGTKATEWCKSPARVVRCGEQSYGSVSRAAGGAHFATGVSTDLVGNCCEYRCE